MSKKVLGEIDKALREIRSNIDLYDEKWKELRDFNQSQQGVKERYWEEGRKEQMRGKKHAVRTATLELMDFKHVCDTKAKIESEMEAVLRKLHRLRQQIIEWVGNLDLRNKEDELVDMRKQIELRYKRGRSFYKLGCSSDETENVEAIREEETQVWINEYIRTLTSQAEGFEAEIERRTNGPDSDSRGSKTVSAKGADGLNTKERVDQLTAFVDLHRMHIQKLEGLLRQLRNKSLSIEDNILEELREYLKPYVEENDGLTIVLAEDIYGDLGLDNGAVSGTEDSDGLETPRHGHGHDCSSPSPHTADSQRSMSIVGDGAMSPDSKTRNADFSRHGRFGRVASVVETSLDDDPSSTKGKGVVPLKSTTTSILSPIPRNVPLSNLDGRRRLSSGVGNNSGGIVVTAWSGSKSSEVFKLGDAAGRGAAIQGSRRSSARRSCSPTKVSPTAQQPQQHPSSSASSISSFTLSQLPPRLSISSSITVDEMSELGTDGAHAGAIATSDSTRDTRRQGGSGDLESTDGRDDSAMSKRKADGTNSQNKGATGGYRQFAENSGGDASAPNLIGNTDGVVSSAVMAFERDAEEKSGQQLESESYSSGSTADTLKRVKLTTAETAVGSWTSTGEHQLSVAAGQAISVVAEDKSGWTFGSVVHSTTGERSFGWFPDYIRYTNAVSTDENNNKSSTGTGAAFSNYLPGATTKASRQYRDQTLEARGGATTSSTSSVVVDSMQHQSASMQSMAYAGDRDMAGPINGDAIQAPGLSPTTVLQANGRGVMEGSNEDLGEVAFGDLESMNLGQLPTSPVRQAPFSWEKLRRGNVRVVHVIPEQVEIHELKWSWSGELANAHGTTLLHFVAGELVELLVGCSDGWVFGRIHGEPHRQGWFPEYMLTSPASLLTDLLLELDRNNSKMLIQNRGNGSHPSSGVGSAGNGGVKHHAEQQQHSWAALEGDRQRVTSSNAVRHNDLVNGTDTDRRIGQRSTVGSKSTGQANLLTLRR